MTTDGDALGKDDASATLPAPAGTLADETGQVDDEANAGTVEETDAGPAVARRETSRLCIATRTVKPVGELMRFVLGPDGEVVPDLTARLPGRGAWLTATRGALGEAIRRKAFARAFKGRLRRDPGTSLKKTPSKEAPAREMSTDSTLPALAGLVEALMEKDALGALGLAKKAGRVVTGATKVAEAIRSGDVAILIHASDAAPDGVGKLDALARRVGEDTGREIALITILSGLQLDLALGRANVVHAALLAHPTSAGFLARIRRLERWRAD